MDYSDKVITFDNGNKYIVVEQVNYENGLYLYLLNKENNIDTMIVKADGDRILSINPELYESKILPLFLEKFNNN